MADGAGHGHELIIIKRHEDEEHAHHSSAWKVAHADFMTAMMAFFLIMWLINVTDEEQRKGISQYFNPIHMSQGSSDLKGLNKTDAKDAGKPSHKGPSEDSATEPAPIGLTAAANSVEKSIKTITGNPATTGTQSAAGGPAAGVAAAEDTGEITEAVPGEGTEFDSVDVAGIELADAGLAGSELAGDAKERVAFQDPFAVLAKLAAAYEATQPASPSVVDADTRPIGVAGGDLDRDPFDPAYWQISPLPPARTEAPGKPGSIAAIPEGRKPDAAASQTPPAPDAKTQANAASGEAASPPPAAAAAGEPPAAPSDLPPGTAAATAAAQAPAVPEVAVDGASGEVSADTVRVAEAIAGDIAETAKTLLAGKAPEISVKATPEGALIGLTDDATFSMFPVGSAVPDPKVVVLLGKIAETLAARPGQIVVRGHTDGRPFHSADYDNWRLSAARAHMAYYMLVRGGLQEDRVESIEGRADRDLLDPVDPYAAENRRIEILIKARNG